MVEEVLVIDLLSQLNFFLFKKKKKTGEEEKSVHDDFSTSLRLHLDIFPVLLPGKKKKPTRRCQTGHLHESLTISMRAWPSLSMVYVKRKTEEISCFSWAAVGLLLLGTMRSGLALCLAAFIYHERALCLVVCLWVCLGGCFDDLLLFFMWFVFGMVWSFFF